MADVQIYESSSVDSRAVDSSPEVVDLFALEHTVTP